MKRAWVVQELLLAPSILHLGGTQMFWECYELKACETYPQGLPNLRPNLNLGPDLISREAIGGLLNNAGYRFDGIESGSEANRKYDLWKFWKGVVELYSAKSLTFTSDKLVALSGIAKLMETTLDDQYCAGLWRKSLVTGLFWNSDCREQLLCPRPKPYRAPSWSWASLDGPIEQPYSERWCTRMKSLINITNCKVENTADNTSSSVTGGILRLSGSLASMQLRPESQDKWSVFFNGAWRQERLFVSLDCKIPSLQFHCLPLFADTYQPDDWEIYCLLLSPTGEVKGQFERSGTLHFSASAFEMRDWTKFGEVKNEGWLEHEGRSRNDQYNISII